MRVTVTEKREVAKGTLFVLFAVEDYPDYRPGAYFWVELPEAAFYMVGTIEGAVAKAEKTAAAAA